MMLRHSFHHLFIMLHCQFSSLTGNSHKCLREEHPPPPGFLKPRFVPQWHLVWQQWRGKISEMDISNLLCSVVDNGLGDTGYLPPSETGTSCIGVGLKGCKCVSRVSPLYNPLQTPACVTWRSTVHFNFFHSFSACIQSDGGRQSLVFGEVVPGCCVRRYPWKRAVRCVLGEGAAQGGEGEGAKATVCDAGAIKSLGRAAVPQIRQHRPESLLHRRHAEVRRHGRRAALPLTFLITVAMFLCLPVVPHRPQPLTSFSDHGSWTLC